MSQSSATRPRWAVPSVLALLGTAGLLATLVLSARVVLPPGSVPAPVVLVGAVVVLCVARAAVLTDWRRRGAAVVLSIGALGMLFGLGPYANCLVGGGGACGVGVTPQVPLLATGALATTVALYFDSRRRPLFREALARMGSRRR